MASNGTREGEAATSSFVLVNGTTTMYGPCILEFKMGEDLFVTQYLGVSMVGRGNIPMQPGLDFNNTKTRCGIMECFHNSLALGFFQQFINLSPRNGAGTLVCIWTREVI
jgi:hypothetical protein